jgi:transketolase
LGVQEATKNYTGEGRLVEKFRSFGWKAFEIDGHSELHIHTALLALNESVPVAIIANTIKGKGISFMENNPAWHHGIPKGEQLVQARKELDI